jgi:hypothetical protein
VTAATDRMNTMCLIYHPVCTLCVACTSQSAIIKWLSNNVAKFHTQRERVSQTARPPIRTMGGWPWVSVPATLYHSSSV